MFPGQPGLRRRPSGRPLLHPDPVEDHQRACPDRIVSCGGTDPPGRWGRAGPSPESSCFHARPAVRLLDGLDQFALGHLRAAFDAEPGRDPVEVALGRVGVDALGGVARLGPALFGLGVGRALLLLRLPVVADLLNECFSAAKAVRRARSPSPYVSTAASWALIHVSWAFLGNRSMVEGSSCFPGMTFSSWQGHTMGSS